MFFSCRYDRFPHVHAMSRNLKSSRGQKISSCNNSIQKFPLSEPHYWIFSHLRVTCSQVSRDGKSHVPSVFIFREVFEKDLMHVKYVFMFSWTMTNNGNYRTDHMCACTFKYCIWREGERERNIRAFFLNLLKNFHFDVFLRCHDKIK